MSDTHLPPDLAAFLREQDYCCLPTPSAGGGTCLIVKMPTVRLGEMTMPVPVQIKFMTYHCATSPVIRTILVVNDRPNDPLYLEFFTNVGSDDDVRDFKGLLHDERVVIYYFDAQLHHRYTGFIAVPHAWRLGLPSILASAQRDLAAIPLERRDFELAREEVIDRTNLVSAPF